MRRLWFVMGLCAIFCAPALWAAKKTAAVAPDTSTQHPAAVRRWPAENLKGTVSMVDPKMDLVVVRDPSGVPFDIKVARSTRIDSGAKHEELSQLTPKESVSIHYVPEARGDVARTIQVNP